MAVSGVGHTKMHSDSVKYRAKAADGGSFSKNLAAASRPEEELDVGKEIQKKMDEIYKKVLKGETQQSFRIGASSFTVKEWDRFLKKFDDTEEEIAEQIKEAIEGQRKAAGGKAPEGKEQDPCPISDMAV